MIFDIIDAGSVVCGTGIAVYFFGITKNYGICEMIPAGGWHDTGRKVHEGSLKAGERKRRTL